jgi:hypothetical protein
MPSVCTRYVNEREFLFLFIVQAFVLVTFQQYNKLACAVGAKNEKHDRRTSTYIGINKDR